MLKGAYSELCYEGVLKSEYAMSLKYCMKENLTKSAFVPSYYALMNSSFLENLVFKKLSKSPRKY